MVARFEVVSTFQHRGPKALYIHLALWRALDLIFAPVHRPV